MRPEPLLALYAGPDQIMTVTSGLASLLGLVLIFWNKVVTAFFKLIGRPRPSQESESAENTEPSSTKVE
jgi:hypothetical protein